jgi:hypothetical protein
MMSMELNRQYNNVQAPADHSNLLPSVSYSLNEVYADEAEPRIRQLNNL